LLTISQERKQSYFVNADAFLPYLKFSKSSQYHDDCIQCDIRYLPIKRKAFEVSVCFHVLEHIAKEDGLKVIEQMDMISSNQVIIAMPVGFQELHEYDGNPYQTHKSGWTPKELEAKGFKVRGSCGLRKLRGERASPALKFKSINFLMTYISQLITFFSPNMAWEMVCVKRERM